jgi:hypothetical protein
MRLHGAEQLHDKAQRASRNQVPCCVLHDVLQRFQTAAKAIRIWRRRLDRPLASDPNNHLVQVTSIARPGDGAAIIAARSPVRTSAPSSGRFRRRRRAMPS